MLLIDLMSEDELEESIKILRKRLFSIAEKDGFSSKKATELKKRLNLYLNKYESLEKVTCG
jgi:hypothetical protein